MVRPVVLAVDDEPAARSSIEGELRKRYGADYEVRCEGSSTAGLAALEQVKAQGGEVALVVADLWLPDMTGVEFLAVPTGCMRTPSEPYWRPGGTGGWVTPPCGQPPWARSTTGA